MIGITRTTRPLRNLSWVKAIAAVVLILALLAISGWYGIRLMAAAQDVSRLDRPLPVPTLLFDEGGNEAVAISLNEIEPVAYEQTEHYALTRDFLLHRERYLKRLLEDGEEEG